MSMKVIVRDLDAMRTEETSGGVPKKLIRDDDPEFLLPQPTTAIEERVPPSIIGEESIIILDRNAQLGPSASEKDSGHSSQPSPQSALMTLKSMEFDENGELLANRPPAVDCSCGYPQECGHMIQCDRCGNWQHAPCQGYAAPPSDTEVLSGYACLKCRFGKVSGRLDWDTIKSLCIYRRALVFYVENAGLTNISDEDLCNSLGLEEADYVRAKDFLKSRKLLVMCKGKGRTKKMRLKRINDAWDVAEDPVFDDKMYITMWGLFGLVGAFVPYLSRDGDRTQGQASTASMRGSYLSLGSETVAADDSMTQATLAIEHSSSPPKPKRARHVLVEDSQEMPNDVNALKSRKISIAETVVRP